MIEWAGCCGEICTIFASLLCHSFLLAYLLYTVQPLELHCTYQCVALARRFGIGK